MTGGALLSTEVNLPIFCTWPLLVICLTITYSHPRMELVSLPPTWSYFFPRALSNWLYRSKAKKMEENFLSDCHSTLTTGWGGKNRLNEWNLHWSFSTEYRGFRLRTGNYFHIFNSAVFPPSVREFIWSCLLSFFLGGWTCTLIQHTVVYFCF